MHLSEILTHWGEERARYFQAVSPPVIQTSNFVFSDTKSFREAFINERAVHLYTRGNNPTTEILRKKIAALEKTEDALVFGSGAAAMSCAVLANVKAGDHIVAVKHPYSWTHHLISTMLPRFGVTHTFVSGKGPESVRAAIQPNTTVLVLESPNSITFDIQDLRACAEMARTHQMVSIIDNTYASPLFQNPAEFGIDIIMHTCSKYLNGHSDVVAGAICGSKSMMDKIFNSELMTLGSILSPHDASLIIRGLRTLELRMNRLHQSGLSVARYLENHPKVTQVLHPLLPSFAQYELAKKQMKGAGGLFSVYLQAEDRHAVNRFADQLNRFLLAVSWGGHESLIIPFSIFHDLPTDSPPVYPWNLVRLYVGLEDPEYLIEDLNQALEAL